MSDMPESLGACVDRYRDLRDLRLAMEKEVAVVAEKERAAKAHILQSLTDQSGTTGVAGERFRAQRIERRVPAVTDWPAFYKWIAEGSRFDVLQRRLANKAITDLWEADEDVPGVEARVSVDLSVTKI
jgi:hypothetical protein